MVSSQILPLRVIFSTESQHGVQERSNLMFQSNVNDCGCNFSMCYELMASNFPKNIVCGFSYVKKGTVQDISTFWFKRI